MSREFGEAREAGVGECRRVIIRLGHGTGAVRKRE
jgi:hypothetical protein